MEKPAEGEFDTLSTEEGAVVATGLAKEQTSTAKHADAEHTQEAHSVFLQEIYSACCVLKTLESTSKFSLGWHSW